MTIEAVRVRFHPFPRLTARCLWASTITTRAQRTFWAGFKKGDLLYIINTKDADWWFAQQWISGDKGVVSNYNNIAEYKSLDAEE